MKRKVVVGLAVAGVVAWGGAALADGKAPARDTARDKATEPYTWQYLLALETGNLPVDHSGVDAAKGGGSRDTVPVIDVGGRLYRLGVDTQ